MTAQKSGEMLVLSAWKTKCLFGQKDLQKQCKQKSFHGGYEIWNPPGEFSCYRETALGSIVICMSVKNVY